MNYDFTIFLMFFKVYHLNNMMKLLLQEQDQLERQEQEEQENSRTTSTENKKNNSNWSDRDISTDSISKQVRQQDSFSNKLKNPTTSSSTSSDNRNEVLTRLGPCMEFVIERQILDILSTLCQADTPPGLRPHVIRVFIFFMTHVKQTILPYVGVYLPIRFIFVSFLRISFHPGNNPHRCFLST